MRTVLLAVVLISLCAVSPALAQIYKWVDKNGTVTFSDTPPPQTEGVETVNPAPTVISVPDYGADSRSTSGPENTPKATLENEVELYVTSWCPYCQKAKDFFRSRGIDFTSYDIEKDPAAMRRKAKLDSRKGVPFAVINGVGIHGYNAARYANTLHP